jgi:hypothetical protein
VQYSDVDDSKVFITNAGGYAKAGALASIGLGLAIEPKTTAQL